MKGCGVSISQYQVANDLDLGAFSSPFRVSGRLSASVSGNVIISEYWENYPDHQETKASQKFPRVFRGELSINSESGGGKESRPAFSQLFGAYTLHRALGLDRSLRRFGGRRSPEGADLLVTVLAARDGYIFWVDLLAESG